ncbi:MAG: glycosyltransferase [Lachnospiraceae bacterium]|nr:glycosyltransferase [Lachnospiraceae bacterium]
MGEKSKICFLQYNLQGGGAERKVCTLANFFVEKGYNVEIGLFGRNIVAYELDKRVKLTFIDRSTYEYQGSFEKWGFKFASCCLSVVERALRLVSKKAGQRFKMHFRKKYNYTLPIKSYILHRSDAVFITMMVQPYNEIMRIIERDIKKGRIKNPYIVMECNNPTPGLDANAADDERREKYYPMAARVVAMTQGIVDYFGEEIRRKCVVIPNPIRDDLPDAHEGDRRKAVVNCCRLNRQKNLPLLVDAFALFHLHHPEYTLELYGQGELRQELTNRIQEVGLSSCAHIYSFDPHVHEKIKDCTMFVSSSDWEGFGNSILEALAIGLPTISTDCDFGPRDMIIDHENGLLVPKNDIEALARAMAELVDNPDLSKRLSREAVKVRELYDVNLIGQKWLELIDEVVEEREGLA